jgi:hypothetical protein
VRKKHPGLQEAIALLASKFEFGALMAETTPAFFLNMVAEEIDRLRALVKMEGRIDGKV